jgi:hypothetical protein
MRSRTLGFLMLVLTLPFWLVSASAQSHNVNCKEEYQFSKTQVDISADILKKISGEVKLDPQLEGKVNEWTTLALAQQGAICNAYKKSSEAQFPTTRYLEELDKLRQWDDQFLQMVLGYVSTCQTKATKGEGPELAQHQAELKANAQLLINNLPTLKIPDTAKK